MWLRFLRGSKCVNKCCFVVVFLEGWGLSKANENPKKRKSKGVAPPLRFLGGLVVIERKA